MAGALNLKTKMIVAVSVLTAFLLLVTCLTARHYFVQQMKQLVYSQQFNMLSAIADQTDDKLASIRTELAASAGTLNRDIINDPARVRNFFTSRPDTLAMFDNGLFLFSPEGRLLFGYPVDPTLIGKNFSHRDYFVKTVAARAPQISEPFVSQQGHRHPIIMFTAPVFDDKGGLAAILAGSIDLTKDNFLSRLASIRVGETGHLYLYNDARVVIAHPNRARIFTKVADSADGMLDKVSGGFDGTAEWQADHQPVVASFKRLKTTRWVLAANLPQSEAYAPVQRGGHFLLVILVVVFLLAIIAVYFCMAYLTDPLASFTRQIHGLTRGEGEGRIKVERRDEIGMLGNSFNLLLDELEKQKNELRNQLTFSQSVIDTMPVPVFYKDAEGRYLGCNKAFEEYTGCLRHYILGKTAFDLGPQHLPELFHQRTPHACDDNGVRSYETRLRHRDGTDRQVLFYKRAFPAADGTPAGVIGAMLDITERQRAESELQAQKDFAEGLVLNSSIATFVIDSDHRVVLWNHACERLSGVMASEVVGSGELWKVFYKEEHPLLADLVLDGMHDSLSRLYPNHTPSSLIPGCVHAETFYVNHRGDGHHLALSAAPIRDAHGVLIGAIETIEDITERKQAQEAHENTRRKLELILSAAGEGIYGVDRQGRVTFVNPAAAQMLGYKEEELLGLNHHSLIHHTKANGEPNPVEECPVYQTFTDGHPHECFSDIFWHKDGTSFPVEYISTPIREDGDVVGAVTIFKDITERNQAEEQLLKLSQAVMQSPVSIIITDPSGAIEYVNPKFTEMSGYAPADVIGKTPRLFKSGKTPDEVYKRLWETITAGEVWSGEIYNKQKNGETYWQHATISPIRNGAGVISHYMAFIESMTERKRLEEQLRQAQKMEAIGQLAGGVAHDFNNILTVIMGFGQLLQQSLDPQDPKQGHMAQILDATDRATHLTRSLLAFSRKQVMLLQQVELNNLTRNHTKFLTRIIGEDITLSTSYGSEALTVMADSGQIEQVLMNLATNARDAMPGGGELTIRTQAVQLGTEFNQRHGYGKPGAYALVTVTDTGCGMDQQTQEKIFEPFFTTKEPGRGTGLGLSIVYGIVKQHGGYITIASQCGFGTTFSIYLPLITGEAESDRKASSLTPRGGSETILVVEDDPAVRRLVESVLTRYGYNVVVAASGDEAIELFDEKGAAIDLALLDVIMPKMNGREVCETLRDRSPRLKVLFLSGYNAEAFRDKGIRLDGVDIIAKPAKPLELAKKVREMLDAA